MKGFGYRGVLMLAVVVVLVAGSCVTPSPTLPPTMYIEPAVTYLREGPALNAQSLVELKAGDQVDVIEVTPGGWVKVRSVTHDLYGYVPKDLLVTVPPTPKAAAAPPSAAPRLPVMYVAVKSVKLREEPTLRSGVVQELPFKTKVEKLDEDPRGQWYKVRSPESQAAGWVQKYALEGFLLPQPKVMGGSKRPAAKKPTGSGKEAAAPDFEM